MKDNSKMVCEKVLVLEFGKMVLYMKVFGNRTKDTEKENYSLKTDLIMKVNFFTTNKMGEGKRYGDLTRHMKECGLTIIWTD